MTDRYNLNILGYADNTLEGLLLPCDNVSYLFCSFGLNQLFVNFTNSFGHVPTTSQEKCLPATLLAVF